MSTTQFQALVGKKCEVCGDDATHGIADLRERKQTPAQQQSDPDWKYRSYEVEGKHTFCATHTREPQKTTLPEHDELLFGKPESDE